MPRHLPEDFIMFHGRLLYERVFKLEEFSVQRKKTAYLLRDVKQRYKEDQLNKMGGEFKRNSTDKYDQTFGSDFIWYSSESVPEVELSEYHNGSTYSTLQIQMRRNLARWT